MESPTIYATLAELKSFLGLSGVATHDADLLWHLGQASRSADSLCGRHFYSWSGAKYLDGPDLSNKTRESVLLLPDLLSLTEFAADTERDGSFDGEVWTQDTDFWLGPNGWPKTTLEATPWGTKALTAGRRLYRATGIWGYGDGSGATPYRNPGATATIAGTTATTGTLSVSGAVVSGQTILVESEQIFVGTASGANLSDLQRGINGTSAADHASKAVYVYTWPAELTAWIVYEAARRFLDRRRVGLVEERIGQRSYKRDDREGWRDPVTLRCLGPFAKLQV